MEKKFKKIGILTSGGDAPGMNAVIKSVTCAAIDHGLEVVGILGGYSGLINNRTRTLSENDVANIVSKGGTMLYSDRCDEFKTEEGMQKAIDTCKKLNIDGIVAVGGDGTFRGATDLSIRGIPCIGVTGTIDNDITPAILHIRSVRGDKLKLTVAPKGFGSENMSFLKMMTPAATADDVLAFVLESVKAAGSNPCPPIVVGVGIGSDFEGVALLAKKALLKPINEPHEDPRYAALEAKILEEINRLGIGPQGFGGDTTALAVHISDAPTHIAGLPVAVNICCHVLRHKEVIL